MSILECLTQSPVKSSFVLMQLTLETKNTLRVRTQLFPCEPLKVLTTEP